MECPSSTLPQHTFTQLYDICLVYNMGLEPLGIAKKYECMDLEKGGMFLAPYKAKFHAFSRYDTQFVTTEEERIKLFIWVINFEQQVLSIHMTSTGRSFNDVTYYVKKAEGVRRDDQAKELVNRANNFGYYWCSHFKGSG